MADLKRFALTHAGPALALAALAAGLALAPPTPAFAQRAGVNGPQSVAPTAKRLIPAVVNISTSQLSKGPQGMPLPDVPDGAPFEKFFDDFFDKDGGSGGLGRKVSSLGSGFVIDGNEGLVVTNNHVIADGDEIYVNFSDGSKLKVDKVLGRDPKTDLALIKVTPKKPLAEVKFGSSEVMEVGDWVMAIGNPFGLGGSVTVGIISAKERDINSGPYDDYLQTDAAINKGNSGGPLFNMDGDVIGVNTAIISPTGGSIGIGFAVPSDTAINVIEQLRLYGETRRGWLGVRIQSVTEDLAATLGVPENSGALVASVEEESPAAQSGIKGGDVILKFDGKDVASMRGLPRIVAQTPIGKTVPVEIVRDGDRQTLSVEVGRLKEETAVAKAPAAEGDAGSQETPAGIAGLAVEEMTDDLRTKYGLPEGTKGLVVTSVADDSPAAKLDIQAGDVILEVGNAPATSVAQYESAVASARKQPPSRRKILLGVKRDGPSGIRMVAVPVE